MNIIGILALAIYSTAVGDGQMANLGAFAIMNLDPRCDFGSMHRGCLVMPHGRLKNMAIVVAAYVLLRL